MNIGLLQCDHVAERFRPIAGDYPEMFRALLTSAPNLKLVPFDVCNGAWPTSLEHCDAYLCTGSRWSVYDDIDWIHKLKSFVRRLYEAQMPFIGICFGHQMLAEALGGKVEKSAYGWGVGIQPLEITRTEAWMRPAESTLKLHYMHQDQVTRVPENSVILACSPHCPVAMLRIGERMLGLQAHPEFTTAYSEALLADRLERIGAARVQAARASLMQNTDEDVFVKWMVEFLTAKNFR